jgi:hypothetical protein
MQKQPANQPLEFALTLGLPLAVLAAIVTTLYDTGVVLGFIQVVELLVIAAGFVLAGGRAARLAGTARSGALAGLVTALLPGLVLAGHGLVLAAVAPATFARTYGRQDLTSQQLLLASVGQAAGGIVLWVAIGAALGVIGGLFGRGRRGAQPA